MQHITVICILIGGLIVCIGNMDADEYKPFAWIWFAVLMFYLAHFGIRLYLRHHHTRRMR